MAESKIKGQKSKIKKAEVKTVKSKVEKKTVEKPVVKSVQKAKGLKVEVLDLKGKVIESMNLPKEIFGAKINKVLLAQAVRVYLANQRKGTHSTKTRGEVEGSTAKIYRQKGTGRARHGSKRAPIFVKGGIVFGPKPRDYSLKLPKKMRRLALFSSLTAKKDEGKIIVLSGLEKIEAKTNKMADVVKNLKLEGKNKKVLLVTPDTINAFENVYKAGRNLKGVSIISAKMLNTYEVLNAKTLLLMKTSIEVLENTFLNPPSRKASEDKRGIN
ncbi:MAG: 50S ribosomal protein L4 [Candidatus Levybacteria bacterium CG_4_10_14_0_8_um_filter_35_23]|nr:MAG: 50S ribosomal protein L4 [Candidatus Levybacteria bacterium CG_4_10_14_0_8_um_filter_35_23]